MSVLPWLHTARIAPWADVRAPTQPTRRTTTAGTAGTTNCRSNSADMTTRDAVTGFEMGGTERSEVMPGRVGLFRPTDAGALAIEPVTNW
jgi:hypothetical protein